MTTFDVQGAPAPPSAVGPVSGSLSLHDSLDDPTLGSIQFLNEAMARYPGAISFGPGAPHPRLYENVEPQRYVDRFVDHLVEAGGLTRQAARRLLFEYGPSQGLITGLVRDGLWQDCGMDVPADSLIITVGAQEAMLLVLRALFHSREHILAVAHPSFVGILGAAHLLDVPILGIDESDTGPDLEQLETVCRKAAHEGRQVRAFYVSADFSNPGGAQMTLEQRRRLLDLAESEDFLVLEDTAYGFTAVGDALLPSLKALDTERRVIQIGTFAKLCFPGARVGYAVADQPLQRRSGRSGLLAHGLAELKGMVTVNTSPLCQAVIGGMLLEHRGSLRELARARAELYRSNLVTLLDALDRNLTGMQDRGIRWNRPAGGFFVRVELPIPADTRLLEISATRYGVLWTPMAQFHVGDGGDHQLRLSCSYLDAEAIEDGVRRLHALLDEQVRP